VPGQVTLVLASAWLEGESVAHQWSIFPEGFEEILVGIEGSLSVKAAKSFEVDA
jgi:hypothetical protein